MALVQIVEENRVELWKVDTTKKVEKLYKDYIKAEAKWRNIVINPHWLNIMDWELFHPLMNKREYLKAEKEWDKYLKFTTYQWFIKNKLNGEKVKCETIII